MKFWEDQYQYYKEDDRDFELDEFEEPIDEVDSKEFGKALERDINEVFDDTVSEEQINDLMWGASSFPMQPFDSKLKSFRAWLGGFIRLSEKGDGTSVDAYRIANEELEESMENRDDN